MFGLKMCLRAGVFEVTFFVGGGVGTWVSMGLNFSFTFASFEVLLGLSLGPGSYFPVVFTPISGPSLLLVRSRVARLS